MNTFFILTATLMPGQASVTNLDLPPAVKPVPKVAQDAEARKEARDRVLRSIGPEALAFTKYFGDLGIYSLQQCEPETGKKLVKLFNAGDLKLKNPRLALEAVREYGQPAARYLVEHHDKLTDPDALECWCKQPMEYIYDLRDIEQSAEQLRASRKHVPPWLANVTADWNVPYIVIAVLIVLVLLLAIWKRSPPAAP